MGNSFDPGVAFCKVANYQLSLEYRRGKDRASDLASQINLVKFQGSCPSSLFVSLKSPHSDCCFLLSQVPLPLSYFTAFLFQCPQWSWISCCHPYFGGRSPQIPPLSSHAPPFLNTVPEAAWPWCSLPAKTCVSPQPDSKYLLGGTKPTNTTTWDVSWND